MGHREHPSSNSHLEEWASLLGADIADDGRDRQYDLLDEQDERA